LGKDSDADQNGSQIPPDSQPIGGGKPPDVKFHFAA
jgi:hypothetical protein